MKKKVIICGGGAAGIFAAINIAEKHPEYEVTILEKTNKILSKVRIILKDQYDTQALVRRCMWM